MYRFLIVEDDIPTLERLKYRIRDAFPGCHIDSAVTCDEALAILERSKEPFDAVILDTYLPNGRGEDICLQLMKRTRYSTVAHVTAFADDPELKRHLTEFHLGENHQGFFVAKDISEPWIVHLVSMLERDLRGMRICRQLDDLIGREDVSDNLYRETYPSGRSYRSRTNLLADLTRDIIASWDKVADSVHRRVRKHFFIDDTVRPIRAALK